jgi:hypothetical protein
MANWLAIGPAENWQIGIRKKTWAVSPAQQKTWEKLASGDLVFFYATAPVKGIIGYGRVAGTGVDESPFWPEEKRKGHTLWPFRIAFSEVTFVSMKDWETKRITPERQGIVFQRALQPAAAEAAKRWLKELAKVAV